MTKSPFIKIILLFVIGLTIASCGSEDSAEVASTTEDANETVLEGSFYVYAYLGGTLRSYNTHKLVGGIAGDTSWGEACSISKAEFNTMTSDVVCITEGHELDLWAHGVDLKVEMPAGLCEYVEETPYYYFKRQAGAGPAAPAYSVSEPVCAYDYTTAKGPNCCVGEYSMAAGADPVAQPARTGKYAGNVGNCYGGGGLDGFQKDEYGRVIGKLYIDTWEGKAITRAIKAPENTAKFSNVSVANYFNPASHANVSTYLPTADLLGGTNAPIAFNESSINGVYYNTNPFHTYTCYDTNYEVRARIRLLIRDWNRREDMVQGGNPDTGGAVGSDTINDIADWLDFKPAAVDTYPGVFE